VDLTRKELFKVFFYSTDLIHEISRKHRKGMI